MEQSTCFCTELGSRAFKNKEKMQFKQRCRNQAGIVFEEMVMLLIDAKANVPRPSKFEQGMSSICY